MNWLKDVFDWGYDLGCWRRDRHVFFSILISWLVVDLGPYMTGKLDHESFKAHAILAVSMAVTSVLKNLLLNNDPPSTTNTKYP